MEDARLREDIETLAGTRQRGALKKAAVRIEDVQALLQLVPTLKSAHAAGDPVTPAEFDALVDDVHAIHGRLMAIVATLQARIRR